MKINKKHIAFIDEYFANGFQSTRAYMKIYDCSYDTARSNAAILLGKPEIRPIVEEKQKEIAERAKITKEDILTTLMNIAYDPDTSRTNQIKALEQINKMLGFNAPIEQNVKFTGEARLFSDDDLETN